MSTPGSTFRTAEPDLTKLLDQIHEGEIQLPDFQRGWVWDDSHIRALIVSVSKSFPIGSVMLLETGGEGVRFKPRVVEGAPENGTNPQQLILDGQQRMTSLYLALRSGKPVPTQTEKGKDIDRVYYLDMEACRNPDVEREDAVLSLPPDRVVRTNFNRDITLDLSSEEKEYDQAHYPLAALFDSTRHGQWRRGYQRQHRHADAKLDLFDHFEEDVLDAIKRYRVPAIELTKGTSKEAVCQVFEKVNTGGVPLTVFELMTATFAADNFDLRQDWAELEKRLRKQGVLRSVEATDFLQAVTLLASYDQHQTAGTAISCKRRNILNLTREQYCANVARYRVGLLRRGSFASPREGLQCPQLALPDPTRPVSFNMRRPW